MPFGRRPFWGAIFLAWGAGFLLPGCDRTEEFSAAVKEQLQAQKELTEILAAVKDQATMTTARAELKKRYAHFEQVGQKAKALGKPSRATEEKLKKELGDQLEQSVADLHREIRRIQALPGGDDFLSSFKRLR